ncbi:MAG TPA: amino acid adenylation domain-containing protein, partial [Candidatus Deferrimicrobium sp.]|nr:amino acid adenylation domain-containing protein [Candidatus Deferrimicrobium sp.]
SLSRALKEFSRKNGTTLFMTMLTVFKTLLYRYTGVLDICVGTGIANRRYKEMEGMLGMVINTLPLRTRLVGEFSFKQFLNSVKETCLEAYQHEDTPFGKIVEVTQPQRSLSYSPLFQVMFTFMDTPGGELRLPGLELELLPAHNHSAKFDINVVVVPPQEQESGESGEILVEWEYNTDIFDASTIERMVSHYNRLLNEGLNHPEKALSNLPMLPDEEIEKILFEFNDTKSVYPREKTIPELCAEQSLKTPDRIAVFGHGRTRTNTDARITYKELDAQSNRLAYLLFKKGILKNDVVGIMMERAVDLIIGLLGILKAGAAYLPIDPGSPGERIDYILKDSNARILLNKSDFGVAFGSNFVLRASYFNSSTLAYIIYTSGSTGIPKGVPITHANLCPLLHWGYDSMRWGPGDHVIQTLAYYFDWSAWEIFLALTSGASLYMITEELLLNPGAQLDFIKRNDITVMEATPTRFQSLLSIKPEPGALDTLKCLCIGAEKLTPGLVKQAKSVIANDCRVFNLYGPTEATIICAAFEIDMRALEKYEYLSSIPIGRMVGNGPLVVLDKFLNLCPVNVVGELYITGDGVAQGYLNNPELTAEKFFNFHHSSFIIHHSNLYRTGDLARLLNDGNIEFLGRIDQQVKIRGFRIELGEIENRLLKHDHVKEAVVIDRQDRGEKYLCAYIVPLSNFVLEAAELKNYLSGSLPDYMIPAFFIEIAKIPLNPNGKIDRKALPEPGAGKTAKEYTAPRDEVEKRMVEIWADVLNPPTSIGIDDNFFDLGGHSLNATLLIAGMHKAFNVKVPLKEFFQRGCIREIAQYIKEAVKEEFIFIEPVEEKEYYPLSAAQKRMYVLQQLDEGSIAYNIPAVMRLEGVLDKNHLEKVFLKLIKRHESLRTSFIAINEEPVQRIRDNVEFEIEMGRGAPPWSPYKFFIRPFDLSKAPLMRVGLVKEEEEKHLLMVDMHHIITDGTSMELFVKDFMTLYAGREILPLALQYKDYSGWRNIMREKGEEYWLNRFCERPPVLDLPLDYPRPAVQGFEGRGYRFEISPGETAALKALASAEGTTLYMALLTLYYTFLTRITGQDDIVIGTPVAGRSHAGLESIMGMFVNTLALRNSPAWEKNFAGFLKEVNENTLAAFANQDYPYEELVERVTINRDPGRNPLFDTMLNLRNMDISEIEIPGLKMAPFPFEENISKFDLTLRVFDAPGNLRFTFEYCTRLFKAETIERFAVYFKNIIKGMVADKHTRILELEIIPEEEKSRLLYDFNDTQAEYPEDKTIHQLFEEQVEKAPDHIALIGHVGLARPVRLVQLTYLQLNEQSNQVTGLLIEKGVLAGDIVAIMMERSIDLVTGILGILKSGGAYLPIEPEYPQERIDYMLKDSGVRILINKSEIRNSKFETNPND